MGERVAAFAAAVLLPAPAIAELPAQVPAITLKLANGTRLEIGAQASAALVTAALQALR